MLENILFCSIQSSMKEIHMITIQYITFYYQLNKKILTRYKVKIAIYYSTK